MCVCVCVCVMCTVSKSHVRVGGGGRSWQAVCGGELVQMAAEESQKCTQTSSVQQFLLKWSSYLYCQTFNPLRLVGGW